MFDFTFYLSVDSTIKRKGTFCGLLLTPLLPSTANREQPKSGILIDYSKWNTSIYKKGDTDLFKLILAMCSSPDSCHLVGKMFVFPYC